MHFKNMLPNKEKMIVTLCIKEKTVKYLKH